MDSPLTKTRKSSRNTTLIEIDAVESFFDIYFFRFSMKVTPKQISIALKIFFPISSMAAISVLSYLFVRSIPLALRNSSKGLSFTFGENSLSCKQYEA
jgi:hypothetical protein